MKVLISTGYGTGWSTANFCDEMAFDKDLIALYEKGGTVEEMMEVCRLKGYEDGYGGAPTMLGYDKLVVEDVPDGVYFKIREYDGAEWIEIFDEAEWFYSGD